MPNSTFTKAGISRCTAGSDHYWGYALAEKIEGMIEAGAINRRGASGILGCAEDDDGIGRMDLFFGSGADNPGADPEEAAQGHRCNQGQQIAHPAPGGARLLHLAHPCAKNSEISWEVIAPSRMIRQRASSSVRSTMVEGISRGEVPPSTMMEIRPCNWSRTASAVVHSVSPLRLAEVAVIGMLAACTTASGILALGMRRATLPVLAVTFNGRREAAFTIMVRGPGQNFRASL